MKPAVLLAQKRKIRRHWSPDGHLRLIFQENFRRDTLHFDHNFFIAFPPPFEVVKLLDRQINWPVLTVLTPPFLAISVFPSVHHSYWIYLSRERWSALMHNKGQFDN
jgi:hypothetical protein